MIKLLGYFLLMVSMPTYGLVPVEGIIMGRATEEFQNDPLKHIFYDFYQVTGEGQTKQIKLYQATFHGGENLIESCGYLEEPVYSTSWQEKQARRSVVATLQYIGMDTAIKAIGAYAKNFEIPQDEFNVLAKNLVQNYCSKNITIMSLKSVEKALQHYYQNPVELIPSLKHSPVVSKDVKLSVDKHEARSNEFNHVIRNFRAFCSWGGEVEDYRMLTPYLNNSFIMAFIFKNLRGVQDKLDEKLKKVVTVPSEATAQVLCTDLICRKQPLVTFKARFPQTVGSTGIETDLSKMYCHHFRFQNMSKSKVPQVEAWMKAYDLEDPILETSHFISLMTGVPDLFNGVKNFREIPGLVKSSIDERWNKWATNILGTFSRDLLFEESLKVKVSPRRDLVSLGTDGFGVKFVITLGEMDRLLKENDKLDMYFNLNLSKNYLRSIKTKWIILENEVDIEGQKKLVNEISRYINYQIEEKEKLMKQKMWNDDFSKLIADELVQQLKIYRGSLFDSYKDEVLKVPVKFSYGLFALSYIRYRADVAKGRLKLSL